MKSGNIVVSVLFVFSLLACLSAAAVVGTASIRAPAVILSNNTGSLTTISLVITTGNGTVSFSNASLIANSTVYSAQSAALYASQYLGRNESKYNFRYTINDNGGNVSGPSAGAAMTLLAISAFDNVPLKSTFTITGTINPDGTIGQIGGAIDKASAAAGAGLKFIIVPAAEPGSLEEGVYYIAQQKYAIPLIEAFNISQAWGYATGSTSIQGKQISVNLTDNYQISSLPESSLNCSNQCNYAPFPGFANYTLNLTNSQISYLSSNPAFTSVASQLSTVLDQAAQLQGKGYNYIAADVAFLDYINAFYLGSYNVSRGEAYGYMQEVNSSCANLVPPAITESNYEYIIAAKLRQQWANYTINSTISGFNISGSTYDDIVYAMHSAGQANAWCGAASYLYDYNYTPGAPMAFSSSLAQVATQRINRASQYQGMYLTLAQAAYKSGDYPIAIIDADYAYALSTTPASSGTGALINESLAIAKNSTYGAWATEFAKESQFYAYQSMSARNSSYAQLYAEQSYSSASLANVISTDTAIIRAAMIAAPLNSSTTGQGGSGQSSSSPDTSLLQSMQSQIATLTQLLGVALVLIVGCISMLFVMAHKLLKLEHRKGGKKAR